MAKVTFAAHKDNGAGLIRVHTLRAGTSTIVDHELVRDVLTAQAEKNRKVKEERTGQQALAVDGDPDDDADPED